MLLTGLVTRVSGGGPVTVSGTSEGKTGTAQVIVEGPVATASLAPDSLVLPVGHEVQLTAMLRDAQGRVLAFHTVAWASSNGAAAVSSAGTVRGSTSTGLYSLENALEDVTNVLAILRSPAARTDWSIGERIMLAGRGEGGWFAYMAAARDAAVPCAAALSSLEHRRARPDAT